MADTLSSASVAAASAVMPTAVHVSVVAGLKAEITALEADAEKLWQTPQVAASWAIIGSLCFILGMIL